jgi:CheY-like chemotaxis protein
MKILVVDDEVLIARLFQQRFRKEILAGTLEFEFATSAAQAQAMVDAEGADLVMILSDINMPGMSGLELLRNLRQQGITIPMYMISAYETGPYRRQSEELGADGFLPKPLDFDSIRALVMGRLERP